MKIISLDGNISAGKSTLLAKLKEHCECSDIVFISEPVHIWENIKDDRENMIEKFYNNQPRYSFAFQMLVSMSILQEIKNAKINNPDVTIIIERSVFSSRYIFAKMLNDNNIMNDIEMSIYSMWYDMNCLDYEPDYVLYLNTEVDVCRDRITKRNRKGENDISIEYLKSCEKYNLLMLNMFDKDKVFMLNNKDDVFNECISVLQKINVY